MKAILIKDKKGWKVSSKYGVIILPSFESKHLDQAIEKERSGICPICNNKLHHINGAKERKITTLDGVKEWSFNSSDICRRCSNKWKKNKISER